MNFTIPQPTNVDQLIELSAQQYHAGQPELTLATCQQILAQDIHHVMAWSNAAAALAALGRWVDALAYVQQALALAPQSLDAINNGAQILLSLGRSDEAGALFRNLGWTQYQAKERVAASCSL